MCSRVPCCVGWALLMTPKMICDGNKDPEFYNIESHDGKVLFSVLFQFLLSLVLLCL